MSDATLGPAPLPEPPSERLHLAGAITLLAVGAALLAAVLAGVWDARPAASSAPPPIVVRAPTPLADSAPAPAAAAVVGRPSAREQRHDRVRFAQTGPTHVPARWEAGFYPLYAIASRTFAVNWLLLASIHRQETAFSTNPTTYSGLNFAGCCGGPMQFNVTNGRVSTWDLVRSAYLYAPRPAAYDHPTATHPSIYDDFDAVMAAGRLLQADGAGPALDASAWNAAYDYYGHDATGVTYADQVLARAILWSQRGFCINCGLDSSMVAAVHAAYGAPALSALQAAPRPAHRRRHR